MPVESGPYLDIFVFLSLKNRKDRDRIRKDRNMDPDPDGQFITVPPDQDPQHWSFLSPYG
jgi:hypothetical protein